MDIFTSYIRYVTAVLTRTGGWALLCLGWCQPLQAEPVQVAYRIDARLDDQKRLLTGDLTLTVTSSEPLAELQFLMFPEHLNFGVEAMNELTFARVFPKTFSPARMIFQPLQRGAPLEVRQAPLPPGWEPGTLVSVALREPLVPGVPTEISGRFEVVIPERYGVFGEAKKQVTLAGGWYPAVVGRAGPGEAPWEPLPAASLDLTLRYDSKDVAILADQQLAASSSCAEPAPVPGKPVEVCGRAVVRRQQFPLLEVGPLQRFTVAAEIPLRVYDHRDEPQERADLEKLVQRALIPWKAAGLPLPAAPPPLVRAPLRRSLTYVTPEALLLSDRALRVFPLLESFHEYTVLHGLYQSWLMTMLKERERPADLRWVSGGLAWYLVNQYRSTVADRLKALSIVRPLSFIPAFDEMLNAPKFPFSNEIYGYPYAMDALREAPEDYVAPSPGGRVLFMKLEDRYGAPLIRHASAEMLRSDTESFLEVAALVLQRPLPELEAFIDQWQRPYPRVNYELSNVNRKKTPAGYHTDFTLRKVQIDRPLPDEPVQVRVNTARESQLLVWNGEQEQRVSLDTEERVRRIVIDPDRRLLEVDPQGVVQRDDNFWPPRRKVLFSFVPSSLDLSSFRPSFALALYVTNPFNRRWVGLTEAYTDPSIKIGGTLGAFRYFGRYRDTQWRVDRVGVQAVLAHRSDSQLFGPPSTGNYLNTYGARLSYRYESRLNLRDASRGGYFYTSVEGGYSTSNLTDSPYGIFSVAGIKPWAPHPRHVLVGRAQLDLGFGLEPRPDGLGTGLFALGGATGVRGLAPDQAVGNKRWLTSFEYRFMVVNDVDVDVLIGRTRGLQLAVFTDIGAVGDDFQALTQPYYSYGFGVRLMVDMLVVYPAMLGLDFAFLQEENVSFRPIFRFNQPF